MGVMTFPPHDRGSALVALIANSRQRTSLLLGAVLAAAIFSFDLLTPLGIAAGVPYVAVVMIALYTRSARAALALAALGTILTVLGYFLAPAAVAPPAVVLTNRALALFAIWTTTIVTYLHLRTLAELKPLADRDELTGLYNRRYFKKEAARQIGARRRYRYPLSLLMLDVDHFKRINDEYGHAAGDQVLKALARTLHINAREIDTVCRYGGEEFAVLLPFTNLDSALGKARRVQTAINAVTVHRRRRTITFRVSIGVAEFTSAMRGIKEFVDTADRAMYAAKAAGRNRIMTAARREGRRRRHAKRRAKGR